MVEADTGANITVFKAESLKEMAWVELEQTEMQSQGYSGIVENCVSINLSIFHRYDVCNAERSPFFLFFSFGNENSLFYEE